MKNLKRSYASRDPVIRDIKAVEEGIKDVESGKYDKELIKRGQTEKEVVAGLKKCLIERERERERRAELESYDPDPPYTFSDSDLKGITKALKYNWTMLRFIVYYVSTDDVRSKRKLMLTLAAGAHNATPAAVKKAAIGWMVVIAGKFIMDSNLQISGTIPDEYRCEGFDESTAGGMVRGISIKAVDQLLVPADLRPGWFVDIFDMLFVMRDRYPFLFD